MVAETDRADLVADHHRLEQQDSWWLALQFRRKQAAGTVEEVGVVVVAVAVVAAGLLLVLVLVMTRKLD